MDVAPVQDASIESVVAAALAEDHAEADATTFAVVPATTRAVGRVVARASGVLAGRAWAAAAFRLCDPQVRMHWTVADGDCLRPDRVLVECRGSARGLLAAERTALNFLQQLSGVATATAEVVAAAGGLAVLDTRKTVPGLRDAQKAAVRAGGGRNHRRDLADQILLKENHFALSGLGFRETVERAVARANGRVIGVEAETEAQAQAALDAGADYVLLDDFPLRALPGVVARLRATHPEAILEASGGLDRERVAGLVHAGIDRVSVGRITHSAPALDLAFDLQEEASPE